MIDVKKIRTFIERHPLAKKIVQHPLAKKIVRTLEFLLKKIVGMLKFLFDFRGRANRKQLAIVFSTCYFILILWGVFSSSFLEWYHFYTEYGRLCFLASGDLIGVLLLYFVMVTSIRRMHDLGVNGVGAVMAWVPSFFSRIFDASLLFAMAANGKSDFNDVFYFWNSFAGIFYGLNVLYVIFTIVLCCIKGSSTANKYGAPVGKSVNTPQFSPDHFAQVAAQENELRCFNCRRVVKVTWNICPFCKQKLK